MTGTSRPHRLHTLRVPLTPSEKDAIELAAQTDGLALAKWARKRLFGDEVIASPLAVAMTRGDQTAQAIVLLAIIATRLEDLVDRCPDDARASPELKMLVDWYQDIVDRLNGLFGLFDPSAPSSGEEAA